MIPQYPYCHMARIVLETTSPLSIGTGFGDGLQDALVVLDANGLPALPGTSIAGVLRHLYFDTTDEKTTNTLFGFQEENIGRYSRVQTTWGHIHNSMNTPVDGLELDSIGEDLILGALLNQQLPFRDGIRVDSFGVTSDKSKFDCSYVPVGYRFTFDLIFWDTNKSEEWYKLLSLLFSPFFRLGSRTRAGFGTFDVKSIRTAEFDLMKIEDLVRYSAISAKLSDENTELKEICQPDKIAIEKLHKQVFATISIKLKPDDGGFRFGSGKYSLSDDDKTADQLPISEQVIIWETDGVKDNGKIYENRNIVVPATGVKGAISHRMAFHYNRLTEHFVSENLDRHVLKDPEENPAVQALFGYAKGKDEGNAGLIWWKEEYLEIHANKVKVHNHNGIDSFTGGVRRGVLFSEEIVHDECFELVIKVKTTSEIDINALTALMWSLDDLASGRLALGAGATEHGYFKGELTWPADTLKTIDNK